MANETLERHVTDELWWDPKIDSEAIAVSVDDGIVTLRGTVGSFRQKREASGQPNVFTGSGTSTTNSTSASSLNTAGKTSLS
jgi:hypothetical protein